MIIYNVCVCVCVKLRINSKLCMKIKAESLCGNQFIGCSYVPWDRCSSNPVPLVTSFHYYTGYAQYVLAF